MSKTVYIYGLREVGQTEIRYIGQSVNPRTRHSGHITEKCSSKKNAKRLWIEDAISRGAKIEYITLEECKSTDDAVIREDFLINQYRELGHRLTNTTKALKSIAGWKQQNAIWEAYKSKNKEDYSDYIDLNDRW